MKEPLKVIKESLLNIVDDIDVGNSNISEEGLYDIIDMIKHYSDDSSPDVTVGAAAQFLGVSEPCVRRWIRENPFIQGYKRTGFTETVFYRKDILELSKIKKKVNKYGWTLESIVTNKVDRVEHRKLYKEVKNG